MAKHNLRRMLQRGVLVTVNSDDPAYFGGYMNRNFEVLAEALDLSAEEIQNLVLQFVPRFVFERCGKGSMDTED